jgi:DNA-binding response OmpR family regulator
MNAQSTINLLIVDDEIDIRDILEMGFEDKNCFVMTASNGDEALKLLTQHNFHIVLSDVQMPICSGVEFIKKLHALMPPPLLFLMSGFSDVTDDDIKDLGVEKMFKKPFSLEELTTEVIETYQAKK